MSNRATEPMNGLPSYWTNYSVLKPPPGCESTFVDHPNPHFRNTRSVEVGFVMEHRFAFCYWLKWKRQLLRSRHAGQLMNDDAFAPPDLVTWDWHDDSGCPQDVIETQMLSLDQDNDQEIALYAWAGLRPMNDGHIYPAAWLNAIGNVYIIQKQRRDCRRESRVIADRYGNEHHIFFFRSLNDFAKTFERTNTGAGVIWDIDLDYFTKGRSVADQCYTPPMSGEDIHEMLAADAAWMPLILSDLHGITIALEPQYIGGLSISLELYRHWESALLSAPLFSRRCRWRKGVVRAIGRRETT